MSDSDPTALGRHLRRLRDGKRVDGKAPSLRTVSAATGISNAYLSQLESGAAANPSPDKLYALAEYYGVPYESLMREAGYIRARSGDDDRDISAFEAQLMSMDLDPDEQDQVVRFIQHVLRRG